MTRLIAEFFFYLSYVVIGEIIISFFKKYRAHKWNKLSVKGFWVGSIIGFLLIHPRCIGDFGRYIMWFLIGSILGAIFLKSYPDEDSIVYDYEINELFYGAYIGFWSGLVFAIIHLILFHYGFS